MNCADSLNLMSAAFDGQASAGERAALEEHVARCPACAQQFAAEQEIDGDLRRLFAPRREAVASFADRMAQQFAGPSGVEHAAVARDIKEQIVADDAPAMRAASVAVAGRRPHTVSARQVASWLTAMVAGFLLAVLVFQPWKQPRAATVQSSASRENERGDGAKSDGAKGIVEAGPKAPSVEPTVARLVAATGDVSIRPAADADWSTVSPSTDSSSNALTCRAGTTLRTEPGVRCEVQTTDGCVIRMKDDSQVTVRSPRSLELHKGQVWCSAPEDVAMQVYTSVRSEEAPCGRNPAPERSWTFNCPANASLISSVSEKGNLRLTAARGEVEVRSGDAHRRLPPGETVTIRSGQIESAPYDEDALHASTWIDTLLVRKGHADPELLARVDSLLAQIGQAKASFLYEQELRGLGEHCVLPLLRYVQSPLSADDATRRHMAMRIVADLAPSWAVGDLIPLLSDSDEEIRCQSAAALRRLTGQSLGREPGAWRKPWTDCTPTFASWQTWWQNNRQRYPIPEFTKSVPIAKPMDTKKG